jgi:hypothetical protein
MFQVTALYREAVTEHSPGLPRFAATLGTMARNDRNPNGVVSFFAKTVCLIQVVYGRFRGRRVIVERHNPVGVERFMQTFSQGSRETRQPWAVLSNPLRGTAAQNL